MSALIFMLTDAGIQEAFNRTQSGLELQIDAIALGDTGWSPTASATRLRSERQRLPLAGGDDRADRQLHVTALADGDSEYWIREAAAISDLGTVVGIWSDPNLVLGYKSAAAPFFAAFDLALDPLPANSVTVNVTGPNLSLFYAPEFAQIATAITRGALSSARQFDALRALTKSTAADSQSLKGALQAIDALEKTTDAQSEQQHTHEADARMSFVNAALAVARLASDGAAQFADNRALADRVRALENN